LLAVSSWGAGHDRPGQMYVSALAKWFNDTAKNKAAKRNMIA
jgi:hypothetical protein